MRKYKIITLDAAFEDIKAIKRYLSQFYPSTVRKFVDLYKKRMAFIKEFPLACEKYEDNPKYRRLIVADYLAFYMVDEETATIKIYRVLHGSRDIRQYLD